MLFVGLYHANCQDGAGAASVFKQYMEENKYDYRLYPSTYNMDFTKCPEIFLADTVYLLDYSLSEEKLKELYSVNKCEVIILDHHESAIINVPKNLISEKSVLDSTRSGAGIAFDYFYPDRKRSQFINCLEDRDLWKFISPDSEAVYCGAMMLKFNLDRYQEIIFQEEKFYDTFLSESRIYLSFYKNIIDSIVNKSFVGNFLLCGIRIPFYSCIPIFGSDACAKILEENPRYSYVGYCNVGYKNSVGGGLRSKPGYDNCHIILEEEFGGGGHKNAAGFRSTLDEFYSREVK